MMRVTRSLGLTAVLTGLVHVSTAADDLSTESNVPVEITLSARRPHPDPFRGVMLDVIVTAPDGTSREVPAFWAGGTTWKVRYASSQTGEHRWKSACSDPDDAGLHGVAGVVRVEPYRGDNPLFRHGPIDVAADRKLPVATLIQGADSQRTIPVPWSMLIRMPGGGTTEPAGSADLAEEDADVVG
jgi:hypothetical protein